MKKFWLTVDQRKQLIEDLLSAKSDLENEVKINPVVSQSIRDRIEQGQQVRDQLVALFKVEEHEL